MRRAPFGGAEISHNSCRLTSGCDHHSCGVYDDKCSAALQLMSGWNHLLNGREGACRPAKVSRGVRAPEGLRGVPAQLVVEQIVNVRLEGLPRQLQIAPHAEAASHTSIGMQQASYPSSQSDLVTEVTVELLHARQVWAWTPHEHGAARARAGWITRGSLKLKRGYQAPKLTMITSCSVSAGSSAMTSSQRDKLYRPKQRTWISPPSLSFTSALQPWCPQPGACCGLLPQSCLVPKQACQQCIAKAHFATCCNWRADATASQAEYNAQSVMSCPACV